MNRDWDERGSDEDDDGKLSIVALWIVAVMLAAFVIALIAEA